MKPFNALTLAEAERLAILAEECGEVIQVVGKILRHGYDSFNPFDKKETSNRELLEKEIGDIEAVLEMMVIKTDIDWNNIENNRESKLVRIQQYLHHQEQK